MGILRVLLALAVVVAHSSSDRLKGIFMPGDLAVQAFFIISGFYMALVLNEKYTFPGSTKVFYLQRYLRLVPTYWLAVLTVIVACAFYTWRGHHPAGKFELWSEYGGKLSAGTLAILGLTQATMFGLDGIMFGAVSGDPASLHFTAHWPLEPLPATRFLLVPPAWSLSLELMFYVLAPFLVRRSLRFQLGLILGSFALRIAVAKIFGLTTDPWHNRFFPFEIGMFMAGSVAYHNLKFFEGVVKKQAWLRWAATAALVLIAIFYQKIPLPDIVLHWGYLALVAVSVPLLFASTRQNAADRWIGEISYPLYLLHQVTFFALEPVLRRLSGVPFDIATLVIPVLVAMVVFQFFERPFEGWRARFFKKQTEKNKAAPAGA